MLPFREQTHQACRGWTIAKAALTLIWLKSKASGRAGLISHACDDRKVRNPRLGSNRADLANTAPAFGFNLELAPAMTMRAFAAAAVSLLTLFLADNSAACSRYECYEKVRHPDVYRQVERRVVVRPAVREVVTTPPVIATRAHTVMVRPASVTHVPVPAIYGTTVRRVMVRPAQVHYTHVPPVVRTVRETHVVQPGGYRWEHRRSRFGRERKCKVPVAAVTQTITRQVVVAPAQAIPHVTPAVYRDVVRPVVIQPAALRPVYTPPVYGTVHRPVVVRPAEHHVIEHPAVVRTERDHVLVRRGGYSWHRVD